MFEIRANMWSPQNRHFCAKSIKNSRKQVKNGSFSAVFWSKWRDSNSRPPVPETGALPTALHLEMVKNMRFSVSGQTCGQTEDLRNFRQSGVPKKSVFSRGFSVFQKINFEIGGLHPKLARYQLRYTSIINSICNGELTRKDECSVLLCDCPRGLYYYNTPRSFCQCFV